MLFRWSKKYSEEEERLEKVASQIRNKITVAGTFTNEALDVGFDIPEEFVTLTSEFFTGVVAWRKFYISEEKKVICSQNRWSKNSSMAIHHHKRLEEHLTVIIGMIQVTIYDLNGNVIEKVVIVPGSATYKIPKGVPHYAETLDEDTDFIVKFIEI